MKYQNFLKTDFGNLDLSEVLQESPEVLLGVTTAAAVQLSKLKLDTVFDLATSTLFEHAAQIVDSAIKPETIIGKHQSVPNDFIDRAAAATQLKDLPAASVQHLVGVGNVNGPGIENDLMIKSIRDLAFWPPYLAAKTLVKEAYEPFNTIAYDPHAPEELIPRTGQHAVQKVIYRKTLLIESKPTFKLDWDGSIIDLSLLDEVGFSDVAYGAILTFHQRWTPRRVALGTLLHSLPLGPGESTKMAVVDWSRRMKASSQEDIQQSENLSHSMAQSTAISEITNAVAQQTQEGGSATGAASSSQSSGAAGFFGIGVGEASASSNVSVAATYSVSNTSRSETASALQNISSHTHQSSTMARDKRAAVVTEVSQEESENLTTRTITNYNHMHALSLQYYEVVQLYETELRLANVERCIFIPMRKVNFRNEANVRKYLNILIRCARDWRTRDLLLQYRNSVVVQYAVDRFAKNDIQQISAGITNLPTTITDYLEGNNGGIAVPPQFEKRIQLQLLIAQVDALRRTLLQNANAGYRKGFFEEFDRNEFKKMTIDQGAMLSDVFWEPASGIQAVHIRLDNGEVIKLGQPGEMNNNEKLNPSLSNALPIQAISGVDVEVEAKEDALHSDFKIFKLHLKLSRASKVFWMDASFVYSEAFRGPISVLNIHSPIDQEELADLLMQHQLYYSQQVWLRADPQTLIMQLAPYAVTLDKQKLHIVDYIHPRPVTVAGNYVAFRFTYEEDATWVKWLEKEHASTRPRYDLIPVPTGGVFCEAVLGEFNSAEKLDPTRFWKWQDSPIPFAAPDIKELSAGDHQRAALPVPGELQSSGVVKLLDLPALPEGLATSKELLTALMAENIFKNMGALDVTTKLLQGAQAAAAAGDKATQEQLQNTAKGIMSSFEGLLTTFLKSENGVQNITELGSILNKLGGAGEGASALSGLLGGGVGEAAGGAAGAAGAAEAIGPLVAELAPLILLA